MTSGKALFYNVLALLGAGLGLANSLLAWRLFGVGADADAWLLSLTVIGTLNLLALLGVEQFLYCYADERVRAQAKADDFAKTALFWALLSGVVLAALCAIAAPYLVRIFAGGLSEAAQQRVTILLLAMLPQTAATPLLYVTRQLFNAHERYTLAYLLALCAPCVLLLAHVIGLQGGIKLGGLAWIVGLGAVAQIGLCLYLVRPWFRRGRLLPKPIRALRSFVWKSVSMRSGHALHNFLSAVIINGALSTLSAGNIALFQYAKRFADGISSVAVGPHGNIYHARFAKAWSERNRRSALAAARAYLQHVMPLFVIGVMLVWLALPHLLRGIAPGVDIAVDNLVSVFLLISIWSALIAFEAVFVAVLTTAHRAAVIIGINGLFIAVFFGLTHLELGIAFIFKLTLAASVAQSLSAALFAVAALYFFRKRYSAKTANACV